MKIVSEKQTDPFAYFITIRTYATWLHGDERGSIDPKHNTFKHPLRPPFQKLHQSMQSIANESGFLLEEAMRETVLKSMLTTCRCLQWKPFAIHARTNHVHIVVQSNYSKEKTMGLFKQYATKALKKSHSNLLKRQHFWASHGSTKNIWAPEDLFPVL